MKSFGPPVGLLSPVQKHKTVFNLSPNGIFKTQPIQANPQRHWLTQSIKKHNPLQPFGLKQIKNANFRFLWILLSNMHDAIRTRKMQTGQTNPEASDNIHRSATEARKQLDLRRNRRTA